MQLDDILVNELQVGNTLSLAVRENRRSDFGLILSMMSHNVLDNAEFMLPVSATNRIGDTDDELRSTLQVPVGRSLDFNAQDVHLADESSRVFNTEGLVAVKLAQALRPEGLAEHDDPKYIPQEIIENCELSVRARHSKGAKLAASPIQQNAVGLYEVVSEIKERAA